MQGVERILVLVNPTASDNQGRQIWAGLNLRFEALFSSYDCTVHETVSQQDNVELAATAETDLIISVSGDGALHDIAQGLLRRPRRERPMLTVVPIGSGNDFAKSLGIPTNPRQALDSIFNGQRRSIDIGRCNDTVFLETVSFGADAAIALGTIERRKLSKRRGFLLYAEVAIPAILHDLRKHRFKISMDGQPAVEQELLICAIQNGPTYGGGFRIAPGALLDDGLLNICMTTDTSKLHALYALALISRGKHEKLSIMSKALVRSLTIDLDEEIPVQCDGEPLAGTHFEIETLPRAIDVLATQAAAVTPGAAVTSGATVTPGVAVDEV